MRSQPKLTYGVANEHGELPLFRFGFDKKDWVNIGEMSGPYLELVDLISVRFKIKVNHLLVNLFPQRA